MNPEPNDALDKALRLRPAAAPPRGFTGAVLARVKAGGRASLIRKEPEIEAF